MVRFKSSTFDERLEISSLGLGKITSSGAKIFSLKSIFGKKNIIKRKT